MSDGLTENEKKLFLKGVNDKDPPMTNEQFIEKLTNVFMNEGIAYKDARKKAEALQRIGRHE